MSLSTTTTPQLLQESQNPEHPFILRPTSVIDSGKQPPKSPQQPAATARIDTQTTRHFSLSLFLSPSRAARRSLGAINHARSSLFIFGHTRAHTLDIWSEYKFYERTRARAEGYAKITATRGECLVNFECAPVANTRERGRERERERFLGYKLLLDEHDYSFFAEVVYLRDVIKSLLNFFK